MRIVIIANKYWEADPLVGVFTSDGDREHFLPRPIRPRARPSGFQPLCVTLHLAPDPKANPENMPATPRVVFQLEGADVEVWCLQDLMNPTISASISVEKVRVLGRIFDGRPQASLVAAVGTAASPDGSCRVNPGSVVVGRHFFVHDGDPQAKEHFELPIGIADVLLSSGLDIDLLRPISATLAKAIRQRFIRPPIGCKPMDFRLGGELVSVGTINITNHDKYREVDPLSLASFETAVREARYPIEPIAASIETTHGLIGLAGRGRGIPFVWISGIANALGAYDDEVKPQEYAQDFAAAHNAGIAVAWLIPEFVRSLSRFENSPV